MCDDHLARCNLIKRLTSSQPKEESSRQMSETTTISSSRRKQSNQFSMMPKELSIISLSILILLISNSAFATEQQVQQARSGSLPGVSRDIASFCAARPSLPIDLATMVVHVKKNISFNYKLYLFSADHVFQTGQVIPRDDFRIHSFPVKLKLLNEFWPVNLATLQLVGPTLEDSVSVSSSQFNLKQFLSAVPLIPQVARTSPPKQVRKSRRERNRPRASLAVAEELLGDSLPGDESFISHDVARVVEARFARDKLEQGENLNKHIQFDRDDQLSIRRRLHPSDYLAAAKSPDPTKVNDELEGEPNQSSTGGGELSSEANQHQQGTKKSYGEFAGDSVVPVGSFSSFHVNQTYLVRKDFDQSQPQLIRIQVNANQFLVSQLLLISNGSHNYQQHEDYSFLAHKLLRDENTRITSINQIYEDWITRNFYTIVYIQRRLDESNGENNEQTIVNDRLVFRGTSIALLGADQLDYSVKAAAFITEKNGLHYYLEFIPTGKFYLCAVDWTKRPFKMIDSARFPIKATRTQLDNEELLLCPPAVCYSNQPVDEIVGYGRISLPDRIQKEARILSKSLFPTSPLTLIDVKTLANPDEFEKVPSLSPLNETTLIYNIQQRQRESIASNRLRGREVPSSGKVDLPLDDDSSISLDKLVEAIKAGSGQLQTRLHLRDWVWTLPRIGQRRYNSPAIAGDGSHNGNNNNGDATNGKMLPTIPLAGGHSVASFEWRHELARRNDIKVKPDTYGYVLTGHEIDASYRVYNELYLVSANHLITINYTMSNETVISTHPIGDEFLGLSSTLLDPITGAFYDRYANQIFFFKGDRYIGYDYATKKPLEDFLLQSPPDLMASSGAIGDSSSSAVPLVSSLPVVGIVGRQHQVDGIYHDFLTDLVYIFNGMKFYTFEAIEFKNGSFKPEAKGLPRMQCINEHFLRGCNFDLAFRNPCHADDDVNSAIAHKSAKLVEQTPDTKTDDNGANRFDSVNDLNFSDEQQMKLRTIASRAGLLNILVENTLLNKNRVIGSPANQLATSSPTSSSTSPSDNDSQSQGKIVVYLLMAMIVLTVLVTVAMIFVIINWTRVKMANTNRQDGQMAEERAGIGHQQSASGQYLSNQQHHSRSHHISRHVSRGSAMQLDRGVHVKPLSSVSVVKSSRRQGSINNSAL